MDERAIATGIATGTATATGRGFALESGGRRFPILSLGTEGCLIVADGGAALRGFADILEGERLVATCLIVLAAPEGPYLRCAFKRRTIALSAPAADYFAG